MTTTEHPESFKPNLQSSARSIRRGLSGRAVLGTVVVLAALFLVGMLPRWQANAALTTAARDQRPTVSVVTTQRPDGAANLVLPGSTQAIQETAIYARTNGYVRKWYRRHRRESRSGPVTRRNRDAGDRSGIESGSRGRAAGRGES